MTKSFLEIKRIKQKKIDIHYQKSIFLNACKQAQIFNQSQKKKKKCWLNCGLIWNERSSENYKNKKDDLNKFL